MELFSIYLHFFGGFDGCRDIECWLKMIPHMAPHEIVAAIEQTLAEKLAVV